MATKKDYNLAVETLDEPLKGRFSTAMMMRTFWATKYAQVRY